MESILCQVAFFLIKVEMNISRKNFLTSWETINFLKKGIYQTFMLLFNVVRDIVYLLELLEVMELLLTYYLWFRIK
jgi:hypothetical protein